MARFSASVLAASIAAAVVVCAAPAYADTTEPPIATTMVTNGAPRTVAWNRRAVLTGTLLRSDNDTPVGGASVEVWRRRYTESEYSLVAHVTTTSSGVATYTTGGQLVSTRWYLTFPANATHAASKGPLYTVVAPKIAYALATDTVEQNVPAVIRATVYPGHAGRNVVVQRRVDGVWRNFAYRALNSKSQMSLPVATSVIGTYHYRIILPAHGDHTNGISPTFGVRTIARTLRSGMTGTDVLAVERRLAALHYDVGTVDSYYSYDTVHAAMAFQKVNRLRVTGAVDATTKSKLRSPVAPKLRYPRTGNWVEADLTRQVLYYVRDGAVFRILDISSGNDQLFTVDGETQRATTPTGSFHVFHKIDGLRVSRLGSLWRPAYFASGGYAIHGSGNVPAYPDSHGCIRITNPAMNRLFSMLTIGLPVYVYRS